ncbi:hypothetical protein [Nocardioides sp.]|uniref:hypothetical protein n=1 Tax=Nocardioides sp. TaxID=35761 RepID=UPI0031FF4038|nr:hypothetical protein [Nocardioides sp.]
MSDAERERPRGRRVVLWLVAALLTFAVAGSIVVLSPLWQAVQVSRSGQLRALTYGWPFGWLTQDQSAMNPRLPVEVSVISPWEHPVDVGWVTLMLDLAVLWVPLVLAGFVADRALRGAQPKGTRRPDRSDP